MRIPKINKPFRFIAIRLFQLFFFFSTLWSVYWAHIYEIMIWHKTFLESVRSSSLNVFSYSISISAIIILEIGARHLRSVGARATPSVKSLEDLQRENERLESELGNLNQKPSKRIGIIFLAIGAFMLCVSFVASSTVLAFIGLGLTFWGGLFLFIRPVKFVRGIIIDSSLAGSYATIDRMLRDPDYKGKPIYIPPYLEEASVPKDLRGLKEITVFIPAEDIRTVPAVEERASKQFLVKNPKGICITPPGYGLTTLFEKEIKIEFTEIDLEQLCGTLPTIVVNNLELAREFEINREKDIIHIKIIDSVYKNLYSSEQDFKSIHSIGCPLTSAIACALAETTARAVIIVGDSVSSDSKTIEVWFQILEGEPGTFSPFFPRHESIDSRRSNGTARDLRTP
jgi:hypothetical protein